MAILNAKEAVKDMKSYIENTKDSVNKTSAEALAVIADGAESLAASIESQEDDNGLLIRKSAAIASSSLKKVSEVLRQTEGQTVVALATKFVRRNPLAVGAIIAAVGGMALLRRRAKSARA